MLLKTDNYHILLIKLSFNVSIFNYIGFFWDVFCFMFVNYTDCIKSDDIAIFHVWWSRGRLFNIVILTSCLLYTVKVTFKGNMKTLLKFGE